MAVIFAPAYLRAATSLNAIKGFESSGICPYNQHIFSDDDYVAAEGDAPGQLPEASAATSTKTPNGEEEMCSEKTGHETVVAEEVSGLSPSRPTSSSPISSTSKNICPFEIRPLTPKPQNYEGPKNL